MVELTIDVCLDRKYQFSWDVYHIENYLLEEDFILEVLDDLKLIEDKTTMQCI